MRNKLLFISLLLLSVNLIASKVQVVKKGNAFELLKDGKPYYIKGAGGVTHMDRLKEYGGNSIRTWGVDANTDQVMEEALQNGLTVTFGIWMGQERQGFDYSNKDAVKAQLNMFREVVRKYKDHPALLIWGVGNEMDLDYSNFDVWKHLEDICQMIHEEDPNHPTMAVTAGLDVSEIKLINTYTPSLDILGVNTYGDISYLPEAIDMYDWKKPYIVAEWGPYGWWEVAKTTWGASIEETSTQKADTYGKSMRAILSDPGQCLGSYVFIWGHKQEHTATWFGLFLDTGEETEVMDVLIKGWSGKEPANHAPSIEQFVLNEKGSYDNISFMAQSDVTASVSIKDADGDPILYKWLVVPESTDKKTGGDAERAPKPVAGLISKQAQRQNAIQFKAPDKEGAYRLFLYAYDGKGNVATGNIPFWVGTPPTP